jgi:phage shock protein PspC (stress-responsive transcriptional regulator)
MDVIMSETDSTHGSTPGRSTPSSENAAAPSVPRRLYRDPKGPVGGVASGLAAYFDIDPVIVRLLWIVALLLGPGAPAYLVCWVVVPKAQSWPPPDYQHPSLAGTHSGTVTLTSGLVIVGLAALIGHGIDGVGELLLPAALVGFGVYLLNQRAMGQQQASLSSVVASAAVSPGATAEGSATVGGSAYVGGGGAAALGVTPRGLVTPTVLSLLALGAGVVWALGAAGVLVLSLASVAAAGLVIVGGGLLASLWFGRAPGLIPVGLGLSVLLLLASSIEPWFARDRSTSAERGQNTSDVSFGQANTGHARAVGEHVHQPRSLAELGPEYSLGVGDLTLDLSQLDFSGTTRDVQVHLGLGRASVIVPPGTQVEALGHVGLGEASVLDRHEEGLGNSVEASSPGSGAGTLRIDLHVGMGEGTVRRGR